MLFGLAALATAGYLAFWIWFFASRAGYIFSLVAPLVCALYAFWRWRRMPPLERARFRFVLVPWLLIFPAALFVLGAGFLYGGLAEPLTTPQMRYSDRLPSDNVLPLVFANQIETGKVAHPMIGDWLSSDRPPLQTGFTLLLFPYRLASRTLAYQVASVLLQCLWIPALWAPLRCLSIPPKVIVWTLVAALLCGFTLLNSFFVWPKLLAAAFGLAFVAIVLEGSTDKRFGPLLTGVLAAFSLLAHGGAAFWIMGVAAAWLMLRKPVLIRELLLIVVACAATYAPWFAYQKVCDPPGDRLLKMHLAGLANPDSRSLLGALENAYARLSAKEILDRRAANLATVFDHQREYWSSLRDLLLHRSAFAQRRAQFYYFFPALGLYMAGPLCLLAGFLRRYRTKLWYAALLWWAIVLATIVIWCALMFEANSAVVHQGSYAAVLLAITGSVLALWNLSRALAQTLIALQTALTVLAYLVFCNGHLDWAELMLMMLGATLLLWTLRWMTMDAEA